MVLPGLDVIGVEMLLPGGPDTSDIVMASCWCSPSACTVNSARHGAAYAAAGVGGTTKDGAIGSTAPPVGGAAAAGESACTEMPRTAARTQRGLEPGQQMGRIEEGVQQKRPRFLAAPAL